MESEPMLTPKEKSPLTEKKFPQGGSNPQYCISKDSKPNELFQPLSSIQKQINNQEEE